MSVSKRDNGDDRSKFAAPTATHMFGSGSSNDRTSGRRMRSSKPFLTVDRER